MAWAPDYTTPEDLAEYLDVDSADVSADKLALAIAAASRTIDRWCDRQFGKVDTAEARTYDTWYDGERCVYVASIDDLMDTTGLVVEVDGAATEDYTLEPRNAPQKGRPYTRVVIRRGSTVKATARWGWSPSWPDSITQATLLQASRYVQRGQAPFGVIGSPDTGGEVRLLARIDPDVAVMVAAYRRAGAVG